MAKNKKQPNTNTLEEGTELLWAPSGVFGIKPFYLSTIQKKYLIEIVSTKPQRSRKDVSQDNFLQAIEVLIGAYSASIHFYKHSSRSNVERRIKELQENVFRTLKKIDVLDDYSHYLLSATGRGSDWARPTTFKDEQGLHVGSMPDGTPILEYCRGYTFGEATIAMKQLYEMTSSALKRINSYPKGQRPKDWPRINMAKDVKTALVSHLGISVDASQNGIFSNTLREVMKYADIPCKPGVDAENRDVRYLVEITIRD